MPFSQSLADRVRHALRIHRGIAEKKMFGSVCFTLNGNMLVGVWEQSLIVRLGPEQAATALKQDHVREFDMTGRPMRGSIVVNSDGLDSDKQLVEWVEAAMKFVETLTGK
jgi:TfoX/Sxy family transcriptional regulator of competence genes